jgi:hypothetical protein
MALSIRRRIAAALAAFLATPARASTHRSVMSRAELERRASTLLGAGFSFEGMADRQIQEAALRKRYPSFSSWRQSDDWVRAAFDHVMRGSAPEGDVT